MKNFSECERSECKKNSTQDECEGKKVKFYILRRSAYLFSRNWHSKKNGLALRVFVLHPLNSTWQKISLYCFVMSVWQSKWWKKVSYTFFPSATLSSTRTPIFFRGASSRQGAHIERFVRNDDEYPGNECSLFFWKNLHESLRIASII